MSGVLAGTPDTYQPAGLRRGTATSLQQAPGQSLFHGVGLIDRAELVVQQDPRLNATFTNFRYELTLLDLSADDESVDWRWINARRDRSVKLSDAVKLAPCSWREWVRLGPPALDRLRRRVIRRHVVPDTAQRPAQGSEDERILQAVYDFYAGRKHRFEALADFVTGQVLES